MYPPFLSLAYSTYSKRTDLVEKDSIQEVRGYFLHSTRSEYKIKRNMFLAFIHNRRQFN